MDKLTIIEQLSTAQSEARKNSEFDLAMKLDRELDLAFGEKERAVGAWQEHVREHGC